MAARAENKCKVFAWILIQNKVLTADNLARRGWPHQTSCTLCNGPLESALHLCLTCPFAREVWSRILAWENLSLPQHADPISANDIGEWWERAMALVPTARRKEFNGVVIYTMWNIWKERNRRIFEHCSMSSPQVAGCRHKVPVPFLETLSEDALLPHLLQNDDTQHASCKSQQQQENGRSGYYRLPTAALVHALDRPITHQTVQGRDRLRMRVIYSRSSSKCSRYQCKHQATRIPALNLPRIKHISRNWVRESRGYSGLNVNFAKLMMVPLNINQDKMKNLSAQFGCLVGDLPFTYLGMPLGLKKPAARDFMPLVKKCEKRMLITSNLLSQGVCLPKEQGGLGVIDLKVHNTCLLLKNLHKFFNKENLPWVNLIWTSYYQNFTLPGSGIRGSFWWNDILSLLDTYKGLARPFAKNGQSEITPSQENDEWHYIWGSNNFIPRKAYMNLKGSTQYKECPSARNMHLASYECVLCQMSCEETVTHLLIHCPFAEQIWTHFYMFIHDDADPFEDLELIKLQLAVPFFMEFIILICWAIW
ncbi:hypothetical protein U9M48_040667, partial [Paspalum notatum var. saurae]